MPSGDKFPKCSVMFCNLFLSNKKEYLRLYKLAILTTPIHSQRCKNKAMQNYNNEKEEIPDNIELNFVDEVSSS